MAIAISDVSNALQKVLMPYIRDNFDKKTILLDQLKRNSDVTFMNDYFYAPIRSSRNTGVVNLANDSTKLRSGKSSLSQASVATKILTGTFDISKLTIDATKSAKGAVESQLTFQAKMLASDFAKGVNRQMYSDGVGVVSEVAGSSGTATFTVCAPTASCDDGRSIDNYGTVNGDISPTKYLFAGAGVGVGTAAAYCGTISSVSGNTVVITVGTPSALYDAIYLVDGSNSAAGTSEIQGLRAALSSSTGTYAGVARSTQGWTPQIGTTSEALTLSAIEDKYLAALEYAQVGDQYAIFVNKSLFKKYGDLLTAMRRTVEKTQLLGGWTGLEFAAGNGTVGVFLDFDVPDGEVLIINLDTWTICQVGDLNWLESPTGGALVRTTDYITYQATMTWFMNMICVCPAANARLTQKTD
jgi:hypothetical protein